MRNIDYLDPARYGLQYILGATILIVLTTTFFSHFGLAGANDLLSNNLIQLAGIITALFSVSIAFVTIVQSHILQNYSHRASLYFFKSSAVRRYIAINFVAILSFILFSFFNIHINSWVIIVILGSIVVVLLETIQFIQQSIEFTRPDKFLDFVFNEFNHAYLAKDVKELQNNYYQIRDFIIRSAKIYDSVSANEGIEKLYDLFCIVHQENSWIILGEQKNWLSGVFPGVFFELHDILEQEKLYDSSFVVKKKIIKLPQISGSFENHSDSMLFVWRFYGKKLREKIEKQDIDGLNEWMNGVLLLIGNASKEGMDYLFHDFSRFFVTTLIYSIKKISDETQRKKILAVFVFEFVGIGNSHRERSVKIAIDYLDSLYELFNSKLLYPEEAELVSETIGSNYAILYRFKEIEDFRRGLENTRGVTIKNYQQLGHFAINRLLQVVYDDNDEYRKKLAITDIFVIAVKAKDEAMVVKANNLIKKYFKNKKKFSDFFKSEKLYIRFDINEFKKQIRLNNIH